MDQKGKEKVAYLYLILTFVLWGSLYVVSKYALDIFPTFTVSFARFSIAFVTLSCMRRGKKTDIQKGDRPWLLLVGIGGYFISVGAQLLGTKYAGASLASLLNSLNPVTMTLFAAFFLKEKLTVRKIAGIFLAFAGVYVILGGGENAGGIGITLSLFSVVVWSAVSVLMRRITQKYDSLQVTQCGIGIAAICYLPVCLWELYLRGGEIQTNLPAVAALFYMGIVCTGVTYYLWNKSLSILEAGKCSAFYPIQPLVSVILGMVFLGEKTAITFWLGAICIAAGILVNLSEGKSWCRDARSCNKKIII